jgi:hypothetical protein
MYDETSYEPLTSAHGNVDGEIAHLRDTFLKAEYDYLKALIQVPKNRDFVVNALGYPPDLLYDEAQKRIDSIENGEVEESKLETVEAEITLLLASIKDKILLKRLVLTPDFEEEKSNGRTR